jgi:hypothetical protein
VDAMTPLGILPHRVHGQSVAAMVGVAAMVNGPPDSHGAEIPVKESRRNPLPSPTCRDLFPWTAFLPTLGSFRIRRNLGVAARPLPGADSFASFARTRRH